ncbi:MAG: UDP-3-O-(3-hydroxymyristoyl)glucosamine N-acyltransferase [Bacteroidales bacterium]
MNFTALQIAEVLNGSVDGNSDVEVWKLAKIEEGEPGGLSFLSNPKYETHIYSTNASVVIVNKDFKPSSEVKATLIRVDDAYASFTKLLTIYSEYQLSSKEGICENAFIEDSAEIASEVYVGELAYIGKNVKIAKGVKIYPQVYIGDGAEIGENTVLYAGVKIYHHCIVGNDCILHSGSVIGADGFGFSPNSDGTYNKIPQIGNVIIEDNVEIGANSTVDRATMGSTVIRKGAKIDNLIQIAHNCEIGENTVMAAQAGVSGSTKIGKNVTVAGQAGIVGHLKIADRVIIAAQSGVTTNINKEGHVVLGSPAMDINRYKKSFVHFRNLEKLVNKVNELERKIEELSKN